MLKEYGEEYFRELKQVAKGRLAPFRISLFFLIVFLLSAFLTWLSGLSLNDNVYIRYPIFLILQKASIVYLIGFLAVTVFFLFKENANRFQKAQAVLLSIVAFVFSIHWYLFFLSVYNHSIVPEYVLWIAAIFFFGGIIFLVWSTLRVIKRVQNGAFKEGGPGMFNSKKLSGVFSLPFIIIFFIILVGVIAASVAVDIVYDSQAIAPLAGAIFLQYAMALTLPEFFLLAYCKFRFQSFIVERY